MEQGAILHFHGSVQSAWNKPHHQQKVKLVQEVRFLFLSLVDLVLQNSLQQHHHAKLVSVYKNKNRSYDCVETYRQRRFPNVAFCLEKKMVGKGQRVSIPGSDQRTDIASDHPGG